MQIGSKVKVVHRGYTYSTYEEWAKKHLSTEDLKHWSPIDMHSPENGSEGMVVAIAPHGNGQDGMLIAIKAEKEVFIIHEKGVKELDK